MGSSSRLDPAVRAGRRRRARRSVAKGAGALVGLAVVWLVLVAIGLSMAAAALLVIGAVTAVLWVYIIVDGFRAARRDGRSVASALRHGLWDLQEFWVPSMRRKR